MWWSADYERAKCRETQHIVLSRQVYNMSGLKGVIILKQVGDDLEW